MEVQLYAFDIMALDGDDLRRLPLSMRKTNLARLLARRPDGVFVAPFKQGEIGAGLPPVLAASFMIALTTRHAAHGLRCYRRSHRRPTLMHVVRF